MCPPSGIGVRRWKILGNRFPAAGASHPFFGPPSRLGVKPLIIRVVRLQNKTAVLKLLTGEKWFPTSLEHHFRFTRPDVYTYLGNRVSRLYFAKVSVWMACPQERSLLRCKSPEPQHKKSSLSVCQHRNGRTPARNTRSCLVACQPGATVHVVPRV